MELGQQLKLARAHFLQVTHQGGGAAVLGDIGTKVGKIHPLLQLRIACKRPLAELQLLIAERHDLLGEPVHGVAVAGVGRHFEQIGVARRAKCQLGNAGAQLVAKALDKRIVHGLKAA